MSAQFDREDSALREQLQWVAYFEGALVSFLIPPGGFRRFPNSAQISRIDQRVSAVTKSVRGPAVVKVLVLVAWNNPKELDGRAAPCTRVQLLALLKEMGLGMSAESLRKVLEKMEVGKLVELDVSNVHASGVLLEDLATLEAKCVGNVPVPVEQPAAQEKTHLKSAAPDSVTIRPEMELEDLNTLILALDDFLLTGFARVSTDVMAASKEPMRPFLDAVASVAARAAKGEFFEDLTAEIRKAMTVAPSNRVSSTIFAAVYRQKKVREIAESQSRAEVEYNLALYRAQLYQDQRLASAASKPSAAEPGAGPEIQPTADRTTEEDNPNGKVHEMFMAPNSSPSA